MRKLIQTITLRKYKTKIIEDAELYDEDYLVWYKDNTCENAPSGSELMKILSKDHIKPIRYIFNMSDRIILDRDIHIKKEDT